MDFTLDYSSLSERFSKIKNELDENMISLEKLKSYRNYVPSGCQKQIDIPMEKRNASEEIPSKQDKLGDSSPSEESASDNDQLSKKACLQSAVVTRVTSSRTRKKFIHKNSNNKVMSRNRRFLGMVQNTLRKFQDEEVRRKPQELKRKKALEKVEAAVEEEKKSVSKQREELFVKTKQQKLELECLEKMMRIAQSFELWEKNHLYLLNFIATKTQPQIFFLPASLSTTTKKRLGKSRMKLSEKIEKKRALVKETLSRIKQSSYDLLMSDSTEETSLLSEVSNVQNVPEPETIDEKTKDSEEMLQLNPNESESEDFY